MGRGGGWLVDGEGCIYAPEIAGCHVFHKGFCLRTPGPVIAVKRCASAQTEFRRPLIRRVYGLQGSLRRAFCQGKHGPWGW